jgi:hypothetical protein
MYHVPKDWEEPVMRNSVTAPPAGWHVDYHTAEHGFCGHRSWLSNF